ncbi:MAG: tetratricopeptide repeat protein, partial [Flavobacteriales bacterium]|nr:tetratricopeptide repeat protein [Flavobacteriales bacterium]
MSSDKIVLLLILSIPLCATSNDTLTISQTTLLAKSITYTYPDSAFKLLEKNIEAIQELLKTEKDPSIERSLMLNQSDCYNSMGNLYVNQQLYTQAIKCLFKSQEINLSLNDNAKKVRFHLNFGGIMIELNSYDEAIFHLEKALNISQNKLDSAIFLTNIYISLGVVHMDLFNDSIAKEYFEKSLVLGDKMGNPLISIASLGNLGQIALSRNEYREAIDILNQATELAEKEDLEVHSIGLYEKIAWAKNSLELKDEAFHIYLKALSLTEKYDHRRYYGEILSELAILNHPDDTNNYEYMLDSLSRLSESPTTRRFSFNALKELSLRNHDFEKAYYYTNKAHALLDSMTNNDNKNMAIASAAKLQYERSIKIKNNTIEFERDRIRVLNTLLII